MRAMAMTTAHERSFAKGPVHTGSEWAPPSSRAREWDTPPGGGRVSLLQRA